MQHDELLKFAQENAERFWRDAGNHWLNDNFGLLASARVIEVGGYRGNWTNYISGHYDCFVDVYEPVKEFYEHMKQRFSNRPKIQVVNSGVESYTGQACMAVMEEGSTLYTPGADKGESVSMLDISQIVRNKAKVDLLALNCEGSEYNILSHLIMDGEINRVEKILVQFHVDYPDAEKRRDSIRQELAKTHWETMAYPFCWERWERK